MKRKRIWIFVLSILAAAVVLTAFFACGGRKPYKNLDPDQIQSATVRLIPPDKTIPITEMTELADLLRDTVIYGEDNSYTEYSGQGVVFILQMRDGTQTSIIAYNPFLVIDGVGYRTKYEPCEALSTYANRLLEQAETPGFAEYARKLSFRATVMEIRDGSISVEPTEDSLEHTSADQFRVPNIEKLPLQVGDTVEIVYNGEIMESYPAQLGEVYKITLLEQAKADAMWDRIPMVRVNGKLYYDTGKESTAGGRCGMMDGEITSAVDGSEIPMEDNQSNFGSGFGYQYGANGTIEIYMNEKWFAFALREETE